MRGGGRGLGTRTGVTLVEGLVVLLLGLWLAQAGLGVLAQARRVQRDLLTRSDVLGSARHVAGLIRAELETGRRGEDWWVDGDSLWLRAFRGTGIVCRAATTPGRVAVDYSGYRRPDPEKDSVQLVDGLGRVSVHELTGVWTPNAACGARPLLDPVGLTLADSSALDPVVARVFERGSYSAVAHAVRYRRGGGGRQPLTSEVWAERTTWIAGPDRVAMDLVARGADSTRVWPLTLWTRRR